MLISRYQMAAIAFKLFSLNRGTRWAYRKLGNVYGKRSDLSQYLERGTSFLDFVSRHDVVQPSSRLLELGTGWMHWHAIFLRLHYANPITTFDVWDNRQFGNLIQCFSELKQRMESSGQAGSIDHELLRSVLACRDFEELYALLDMQYVIDPAGSLGGFPDESHDVVFSADVLEHVPESAAERCVKDIYRVLKPGGFSLHYIACDDHLAHYDATKFPKSYLAYDPTTWRRRFENSIQYFNRLQKSDWLGLFERTGMQVVEMAEKTVELGDVPIADCFQSYHRQDLACAALLVLHRK